MTLPYDIDRCPGIGNEEEGFAEDCETCLRRTSPGRPDGLQAYMKPPQIIEFWCEFLIEPEFGKQLEEISKRRKSK